MHGVQEAWGRRLAQGVCALAVLVGAMGLLAPTAMAQQTDASTREVAIVAVGPEWTALEQAVALKAAGRCAQVVPLLDRVLAVRPDLTRALRDRAECLAAQGQYAGAATDLRRVLQAWPADALSMGNLGNALIWLGAVEEAAAVTAQAMQLEPLDASLPWNLALMEAVQGRIEPSRLLFRRALGLLPTDASLQPLLGDIRLLRQQRRWPDAAADTETWLLQEVRAYAAHRDAAGLARKAHALRTQGRLREAADAFAQAAVQGGAVFGAAHAAVQTWWMWQALVLVELEDFAAAEPLLVRVVTAFESAQGPEHPLSISARNNLAECLKRVGRYAQAQALLVRNLALSERLSGPTHPATVSALANLGTLYARTGAYARAEPYLARAAQVQTATQGPLEARSVNLLNNLGALQDGRGDAAAARATYAQALADAMATARPDPIVVIRLTMNLALNRHEAGDPVAAAAAYQRADALLSEAGRAASVDAGTVAVNRALLLRQQGDAAQAQALYRQALAIAWARRDRSLEWNALAGLHALRTAQRPGTAAVFLGKLAIEAIQGLRRDAGPLDGELRRSMLADKGDLFRSVAEQLAQGQRVAEAVEVMSLLKDDELRDYLPAGAAASAAPVTLFGVEQSWHRAYNALRERAPQPPATGPSVAPSPGQELGALLDRINLESALADAMFADPSRLVVPSVQALQRSLASQSPGTVMVHYLIQPTQVLAMLTTPTQQRAWAMPITSAALNALVDAYRVVLQNPALDPVPRSRQLFDLLVAPLAEALSRAGARTLVLSLDGRLRYLPFAALHDGQGFLVERYAVSTLSAQGPTAAAQGAAVPIAGAQAIALQPAAAPAAAAVRVAAFGLTRPTSLEVGFPAETLRFSPLPAVAEELQAIVKTPGSRGALPGTVALDRAFDAQAVAAAFRSGAPMVHFATHFAFRPGPADASFMVLGDGTALPMGQFLQQVDLRRTRALVLSACETGVGGGRNGDGREAESFAAQARLQGAGAVVASLWKVSDASTARLMGALYARVAAGDGGAEAVRHAQRLLLLGTAAADPGRAEPARAAVVRPKAEDATAPRFAVDPQRPHAHPFYWAPFVVMGAWRL